MGFLHRAPLILLLAVVMLAGLTACGQKGDLYLPGKQESAQNLSVT